MTALKNLGYFIFYSCFLFSVQRSFAQETNAAFLKTQLAAAKEPKAIIDLTNRLAREISSSEPDSAGALANSAFTLSEKENYDYGKAVADLNIALVNSVKGSYRIMKEYIGRASVLADKLGNDSLKGAVQLASCILNTSLGDYDQAVENALKAIRFYEVIKNDDGITRARLQMAQIYQVKNDLPAAEKILKELADRPRDDKKIRVTIYHTLANVYGMQGKYDEALVQDKKALILCEGSNMLYLSSPVYDNMANCYMYSGDLKKAKEYFYKCLQIDSSFGNKKQMADTYLNLGQLAILAGNHTEAIQQLKHSISLAGETGYRQGAYSAWLMLGDAYTKSNRPDSALAAVNRGYALKDSIINERTESRIAELETMYDTEKKEQQLILQKDKINKQRYILLGLGLALLLITFTGILYARKRSLQNKIVLQQEVLKQQDISAKAIIRAEENERKKIAADLHDGVGQMMSAAKMNLSVFEHELKFDDEKQRSGFGNVISLVDESCRELRNVSHRMMPDALLKSGLAGAIKEFLSKIDTRLLKVSFHSEGPDERPEADVETVLYRVIQECVNNVLKHAEATHLDISLIREKESIDVTIEDNGKGFDPALIRETEGIGMKNIYSRIGYLRGSIQFSSSPGKGTLAAIHIPLTERV